MTKEDSYSDNLKRFISNDSKKIEKISHVFGKPMAMDMGTTNTRIYMKGYGLVLDEPSVIAYEKISKNVLASGKEAKRYLGKAPQNIEVIKPLSGGHINDFDIIKSMLKEFFNRVQKRKRIFKSRLIVAIPSHRSSAEKKIIKTAARESGIGQIYFIEEPISAAIDFDINVANKKGQMIVDIGGGSLEISIISNNSIIYSDVEKLGGDAINEAIIHYIKAKHHLHIGENRAEECKLKLAAIPPVKTKTYKISGKDTLNNIPKEITLQAEEVNTAIADILEAIINMIKKAIDKAPKELQSDILQDGFYLTGGGSLLPGLKEFIERKTALKCSVANMPVYAIIRGASLVTKQKRKFKKVLLKK